MEKHLEQNPTKELLLATDGLNLPEIVMKAINDRSIANPPNADHISSKVPSTLMDALIKSELYDGDIKDMPSRVPRDLASPGLSGNSGGPRKLKSTVNVY